MVFISTQKRQGQFLITCYPHYKSLGLKAVAATLCLETALDPFITTSSHPCKNGIQQASEILFPGVAMFSFKTVLWDCSISKSPNAR